MCDCHDTEAQHDAEFERDKAIYLPQYEAEKRAGLVTHCLPCEIEARGPLVEENHRLCPPGRHVPCEVHRG